MDPAVRKAPAVKSLAHPHPSPSVTSRRTLVTAVTSALVASLVSAAPGALADPLDPADLAGDDHGHDHQSLGDYGDTFAEGTHYLEAVQRPADPFVVGPEDGASAGPVLAADEPLAWVGSPPDPADIPAEWLVERPAEEITPSTPEELMSADTGYLAQFGTDADTSAVPAPPTKSLPGTLDAASPWQYTYACDPNNKPGMLAFAALVSSHYNRPYYSTSRTCLAGDNSQHYEGRAFDWAMNVYDPADKAIGDSVAQWLSANNGEMARRFGVMSIIWNRKSWYMYDPGSWKDYTGPSPHTDHLHISFTWDGAMKRTSWWTGTPVTTIDHGTCRVYSGQYAPRYTARRTSPCPTNLPNPPYSPYPVVLPNAVNNYVKIAQQHLGFTGGDVDGSFGPITLAALLEYQGDYSVPVTGVLDNATWAKMLQVGIPDDPPASPPKTPVSRVAGANRYATAAKLSSTYPTGRVAYVTTGKDFPDALAASARAGATNNPVLLTPKTALPKETKTELTRLKPSSIVVVGGSEAISGSVVNQLKGYTAGSVTRISGENRYATAGALARKFGSNVPVVYVATGDTYPDAMGGSARAAFNNGPVLLTRQDSVPSETVSAMQAIRPQRVVVLGGAEAVSDPVANQLKNLTVTKNLQRVYGSDRYETAAELAAYYPTGLDVVYVSTGRDYPDALSGSARAGVTEGPMLLTRTDSLPDATRAVLNDLKPGAIVVVGGKSAVSQKVLDQLAGTG